MSQKKKSPVVIIVLAAVLVFLAAGAIFGAGYLKERREKMEAQQELLYAGWNEYLGFLDEVNGIERWTLRYVSDYLENPDWDRLLKARAAVSAAREALKKVKLPDVTVGREARNVLNNQKEELVSMSSLLEETALKLDSAMMFMEDMSYTLENFYLYRPDYQQAKQDTANYEAQMRIDARYAGVFTNRLFQLWNMKDRWDTMLQTYPSFASFCDPWEDNAALLEKKAGALVDEYSKLAIQDQALVEQSELMLQAVENADLQALAKLMELPSGMPVFSDGSPAVFPGPQWVQTPAAIYYLVPTEDGGDKVVFYGTELTQTPVTAVYYYDYVTREEYDTYYKNLRSLGFNGAIKDEEDKSTFMVVWDDYVVSVQWSPTVTNLFLNSPVPALAAPLDYIVINLR